MTTQHTPTPWALRHHGAVTIHHLQFEEPLDLRNEIVCAPNNSPESVANVAFIERAVNCHDELLACLIELASGHSMAGEAKARAAIARATGETP